jgi:hypothetical protein
LKEALPSCLVAERGPPGREEARKAKVGFIGWGIKEAGIIAIVLSALWLANSLWLGKRQEVLAEQQAHAEQNNAEAAATA